MSDDTPVDQNRLPLHPLSDLGSIPWTGSDQWDVLNEQNSFSSLPIDIDSESTRVCRKYGVHRWPPRDLKKISVLGPLQNEGRAMGPPDPSQPSMDAVNNGRSFICAERSNLDVACSKEGSIIPQKRKRGKTGVKIEHQDGISQLTSDMPSNQASLLEEGILQLTFDRPSNQVLDTVAHVKPRDTTVQDTKTVTIRAKYKNGFTIKFKLPLWSGLEELHQQVGKRLNLKAEGYDIMYEDEDGEPILIACDEDLQLCINTSRSSGKNSIVVLLGPKKLL
ncbi:hypothetical protein Vadar_026662 [Vaccinium darrowii]|uniref:Uncharacterized protein n=1 Tax=Vaccinium darrowii TaxID=229202 RepID=A0ACB7XKK0_9ERIC|nr:hypothetical protein Vadar_026662 [Vaccinium darrowii]